MDQFGALKRMVRALAGHQAACRRTELFINDRQKRVRGMQ
jgi:hypothetical protein